MFNKSTFSISSVMGAFAIALFLVLFATKSHAESPADRAVALVISSASATEAAPAAVAGQENKVQVSNPYGLKALWQTSDGIAKAVLLILCFMSAGSWYILVVKLLEQNKMSRQSKEARNKFWPASSIAQGAALLDAHSPYRYLADASINALKTHEGLMGHIPMSDWIAVNGQRAVERIQSNMQSGLAFLATVGSTAPFVGLFGTVWGIYHALTAIGISGQASIDKVAGPVGEALIMTAIGLAVAVPAVLAYNWLVRRNKVILDDVRAFSAELHAVTLGTLKS